MCQGGRLFGPFEPFRCRLDTESFSYALPVVKVAEIGSLAKYSYLADGSKSKAENGSGAGPAGYISQLDISLPAARPSRISVEEMVTSGAFKSQIL